MVDKGGGEDNHMGLKNVQYSEKLQNRESEIDLSPDGQVKTF
jgi:hypothetical protein